MEPLHRLSKVIFHQLFAPVDCINSQVPIAKKILAFIKPIQALVALDTENTHIAAQAYTRKESNKPI